MKKALVLALLSVLLSSTEKLVAQSACPVIVQNTFRIISDVNNSCLRNVSFDFINPTNGNKTIKVVAMDGNTEVLNVCVNAAGQQGVQRNYTSTQFSVCNIGNLVVTISPYTGSNCNTNSACAPTIRSIGGAPLPVVFASFSLSRSQWQVTARWETATEMNNKGFYVERNTTGVWETIAFVPTQALEGNSNSRLQYQYNDINHAEGISQYRIRQEDFDGVSKYSEVRAIRSSETNTDQITVFPNPAVNGIVNVVFAGAVARDIVLFDMTGRTVKQWNSYNSNSLQVSNLNAGMYTIRVINKETALQQQYKIMVTGR